MPRSSARSDRARGRARRRTGGDAVASDLDAQEPVRDQGLLGAGRRRGVARAARALAARADRELEHAAPHLPLVAMQMAGDDRSHVSCAQQRQDRIADCDRPVREDEADGTRPLAVSEGSSRKGDGRGVGFETEHDDLHRAVLQAYWWPGSCKPR